METAFTKDPIDRDVLLAHHSGKPHNSAIAHLTATHSLRATADYLLDRAGGKSERP